MHSLFITGTDTDVGKTVVTAGLAGLALSRGQTVCVYKPIQTGSPDENKPEDLEKIRSWCGEGAGVYWSYCFADPVAPYVADPGRTIKTAKLIEDFHRLRKEFDVLLVEGAGGLRVPIKPGLEMIDLIRMFHLPVVLVARPSLGTINHTLLSAEALVRRRIDTEGVVVSNKPAETGDKAVNTLEEVLHAFLELPLLGMLPSFQLEPGCFAPDHPNLKAFENLIAGP